MLEKFRLLQLMVFAVLALVSYAVFEKYYGVDSETRFKPFTKGYSLEGVVIKTSDEAGEITSTIESPSMIHYADTEISVINEPRYTIHEKTGDWIFTSNKGEINKEQTELTFPDVVNFYLATEPLMAVSVKSSHLVVDINNKIGRTADKVIVKQPGAQLTGLGSVINFADQEIEIIEDMYAEFEN